MRSFVVAMHECGSTSYAMVDLFGVAVLVLVLALALRKWTFAIAALVLGGAIVCTGLFGQARGRAQLEAAIESVPPAERELLMAEGFREAKTCQQLGLGFGVPVELLASIAFVALRRRR